MLRRGPIGPGRRRRRAGTAATCLATIAGAASAQSADAICSVPPGTGRIAATCPAIAGEQAFVVPPEVTSVRVTAVGASGGAGGRAQYSLTGMPGSPGAGAIAVATLAVRPGSTLYVLVGGVGA